MKSEVLVHYGYILTRLINSFEECINGLEDSFDDDDFEILHKYVFAFREFIYMMHDDAAMYKVLFESKEKKDVQK